MSMTPCQACEKNKKDQVYSADLYCISHTVVDINGGTVYFDNCGEKKTNFSEGRMLRKMISV